MQLSAFWLGGIPKRCLTLKVNSTLNLDFFREQREPELLCTVRRQHDTFELFSALAPITQFETIICAGVIQEVTLAGGVLCVLKM